MATSQDDLRKMILKSNVKGIIAEKMKEAAEKS